MARIQFTSGVEEYIGKLAGSIFQDSYMGMQVRGWYKARNPQTQLQQLRRGNFRFLTAGWRNLTSTEKGTFIAATGTIPEALRLYIGANINLLLIGLSIISSYTESAAPDAIDLLIVDLTTSSLDVQATGSVTVVPAGCTLLIYATAAKPQNKIFTNPSQYQPITTLDEGSDVSVVTSIYAAWVAHYGVMPDNIRICIKAAVISKLNGMRSAEFINCLITTIIMTLQQAFDASITAGDSPQINYIDDGAKASIFFQRSSSDGTINTQFIMALGTIQLFATNLALGGSASITIEGNGAIEILSSTGIITMPGLIAAANDTDAAAAGVPINGLYQNAGIVQIRLS